MGYEIVCLQNVSCMGNSQPTIKITKDNPEWNDAYKTWLSGKNPTNAQEWKQGVFAVCELKNGPIV